MQNSKIVCLPFYNTTYRVENERLSSTTFVTPFLLHSIISVMVRMYEVWLMKYEVWLWHFQKCVLVHPFIQKHSELYESNMYNANSSSWIAYLRLETEGNS